MPSKGRANPCHNPMKKKHSKLSQFKNVTTCQSELLMQLRDNFPEFKWKEETRLCEGCRGHAYRQLRARKVVQEVLQDVIDKVERMMADEEGTREQNDAHLGTDQQQPCSSRSFQQGSADLLPSLDVIASPSEDFLLMDVDATDDTIYEGSTRENNQLNRNIIKFPKPAFPTSANIGTPSSPSTSVFSAVSVASTSASVQSTYTTSQTVKLDLFRILSNLGIPTPERNIQHKKKKLHALMDKASGALKELFKDFAGEELVDDTLAVDCAHCALLFDTVKLKLQTENGKKEKYMMLTALPPKITRKTIHEELHVSTHVAKMVSKLRLEEGPFSFPVWKQLGRPLDEGSKKNVVQFYLSDDSSRVSPNARDSIMMINDDGNKLRVPRRFMLTNLRDSYEEFKQAFPEIKISISKFAELRPKNCKWPGNSPAHNSCVCVIHENFKFLLEGLKNASLDGMEQQFESRPTAVSYLNLLSDYKDLIEYLICSPPTEDCYMGYCGMCPTDVHLHEIMEFSEGSDIIYKAWTGNDLTTCTAEHDVFAEKFGNEFTKFLLHDFVYEQQKKFVKDLKVGDMDKGTSAVLTVDFGENYSFVIQDAVQGFHWNNRQATIHPFVLYTKSSGADQYAYKTYFVISDDLRHDASSFHSFRTRVIQKIREQFPRIKNIDYVSDGAASQYKNKKNIGNLVFHADDFNMSARWIFTATGHGKSTCDAMSAVVKRFIRLWSLTNKSTVATAEEMFKVASKELTSPTLEFIFVTNQDVSYWRENLEERYRMVLKVPSIRKCHFFSVAENKKLVSKRFGFSERMEICSIIKIEDNSDEPAAEDATFNQFKPGQVVAIRSGKGYQIGMVLEIPNPGSYSISVMKKTGRGGVALSWFDVPRIQEFTDSDLILRCQALQYIEENKTYRLTDDDLYAIRRAVGVR